jgi:hypothetical protein
MNSFWQEVRIIPRVAWLLAFIIAIGYFLLVMFIIVPHDMNLSLGLGPTKATIIAIGMALFCLLGVLLFGYINIDARRRGMRHLMWTLLAILIPYGIGIILYFVLRDPLLISCTRCGTKGRASFVFCPQCGNELLPSCSNCKRAVDPEWNRCAYCGTTLPSASNL